MASSSSSWIVLVLAGLLEIVWAVGLKYTHGFTRLGPSIVVVAALVASVYLLSVAARTLPIGTAYAVWVGIGATGAALLGVALFREPLTFARAACLALLVASIIGLKLTTPAQKESALEGALSSVAGDR